MILGFCVVSHLDGKHCFAEKLHKKLNLLFAHAYFSFDSVPVLRHLLTMLHPLCPRVQGWLDSTILRGTQESCVVCKTSLLPLNRQIYVADCACGP